MSRFRYIAVGLTITVGLIVAFVKAQESSQPGKSLGPGAAPGRPGLINPDGFRPLSPQASPAGQKAAANQPNQGWTAPGRLAAAEEDAAVEGVRSVLKRPAGKPPGDSTTTTKGSSEAVPPDPVVDSIPVPNLPVAPPVPAGPGAAKTEPAPLPLLAPQTDGTEPPPAAPGKRDIEKVPSRMPGTPRVSSRPGAPVTPPLPVASKPISSRRAVPPAGLGGGTSNPGAASLPASTTDTLTSSVGPLLRVDMRGPTAVTINEESPFKVTLANEGTSEARSVVVRVALPSNVRLAGSQPNEGTAQLQQENGTQRLVWTVERLPGRATKQLALTVVAQDARPFDLAVDWAVLPVTSSANIVVHQPLLEVALTGPRELVYGETKVYSVVLSNPGTGDAKNVSVSLALGNDSADRLDVGTIPAGTNRSLEVEVTAHQTGKMQIRAVASGDNNLKAEAAEEIVVRRAELQIAASGPEWKFSGATGAYEVTVSNTGSALAKNVAATVRLPRGVKYLNGLETAAPVTDVLTWRVGDLAPGTDRTYRFTCQLTSEGDTVFQLATRCDGGIEAKGEVVTKVEALADLKLAITDPQGPIPVGEAVAYEIQITNRGTKAAEQVHVVAQFSEGIEPVGADGGRAELVPGQVVFQPLAKIGPSETVTLTVRAKAEKAGNHVFRAQVTCGPDIRLANENTTRFFGQGSGTVTKRDNPAPSAAPKSPSDTNSGITPRVGARSAWVGPSTRQ